MCVLFKLGKALFETVNGISFCIDNLLLMLGVNLASIIIPCTVFLLFQDILFLA